MNRGRSLLRRQFEEGALPPEEDAELQELLRTSEELRAEYNRYVEVERELEGREVPLAQVERLIARGAPAPADAERTESGAAEVVPLTRRVLVAGGAVALLAAAAILVVVNPPDEFTERSGGASGRTAWITVFQESERSGRPEVVRDEASVDQPFAFAYTNLSNSPYRYLAVAGRDAAGRVHWFHPPYGNASDQPRSVKVVPGRADEELGELIYVRPATGPFEICGMFTRAPIDVRELDTQLEAGAPWPAYGALDCHSLRVER